MLRTIVSAAVLALLVGCSSSDSGGEGPVAQTPVTPPPATQPPATQPPATQPPPPATGTTSPNPTGSISGVWFGQSNFGDAVFVIDNTNRLIGLSENNGSFEILHGTTSQADRFLHRDSTDPAHGDSFTLAGDLPSVTDPALPDTAAYSLTVTNDGQQLDNASAVGAFSLTFATTNDLPAVDTAFLTGTWRALTSFCIADCDLELQLDIADDGSVSGFTNFEQSATPIPLQGALSAAADSTQYQNISFVWNGTDRSGVIHRDRTDPSRIVLNTVGPDEAGNRSFSAVLTRQ